MDKLIGAFIIILFASATAFILGSCTPRIALIPEEIEVKLNEPKPTSTIEFRQVEWIEINPPPSEEGPCYAYFKWAGHSQASGVWCK